MMKNKYHIMFVYLDQTVDIICEKFYVKDNRFIIKVNSKISHIYNAENITKLMCEEVKDEVEN